MLELSLEDSVIGDEFIVCRTMLADISKFAVTIKSGCSARKLGVVFVKCCESSQIAKKYRRFHVVLGIWVLMRTGEKCGRKTISYEALPRARNGSLKASSRDTSISANAPCTVHFQLFAKVGHEAESQNVNKLSPRGYQQP